jgi:predicted nuclease of predicted toxin-antitoxin system
MNLTPRWVDSLTQSGHDSVHWSSVGEVNASDDRICTYARDFGWILLTNDLDCVVSHWFRKSVPGIFSSHYPLTKRS